MADALAPPFFTAYVAVNVKQHVPIVLSLQRPSFNKWKVFFTALYANYGLLSHIEVTLPARPADPTWSQPNACIRGWMYCFVDDPILDLAMDDADHDARLLYVSIEALFEANKEPHAVVLGQEFHSMFQGDLSVDAYAHKMKHTTDALREVGHLVSNSQLVLNLLHGLNRRFTNTVDIITNPSPLPDFRSVTNMLHVKELRLATRARRLPPRPFQPAPSTLARGPHSYPPPMRRWQGEGSRWRTRGGVNSLF